MCGCVHRSVIRFCAVCSMLYVCGKVHTAYQTSCPLVVSVWEHKHFIVCVCVVCSKSWYVPVLLSMSLIKSEPF